MAKNLASQIIAWYGDQLDQHIYDAPDAVRWWLQLGFNLTDAKHTVLPDRGNHRFGQTATKICLDAVTMALNDFSEATVTSIFMPSEPFIAMGVHPVSAEAIANFSSGAHAERGFVSYAEESGIPETYCSYHKVLMGMALSGVLEKPRMLASCSVACDANNLTFKTLAKLWDVPSVYVDVPYEISEDSIMYVADELRGLAGKAEEVFGRKIDQDALCTAVAASQRTLKLLAGSPIQRRDHLAASDMGNEMQQALAAHLALGSPETQRMAEQMGEDFAHAPSYNGLSLVWVHTAPFFSEPLQGVLNQSSTAQIVASEMLFDQVPLGDETPFRHRADKPFEAMAERLVRNSYNGPAARRANHILELCRQTHADGAVIFCHWGCKETAGAAQLIRRTLERAGFPALVLDGDGCDRANCMEGQLSTRMSAFLEMLRARQGDAQHG